MLKGDKIHGVSSIHHDYQSYLIDIWGVVYDGRKLIQSSLDCIKELVSLNKEIIFLTNSPKRSDEIKLFLAKLGIDSNLYIDVLSSGELLYQYFLRHQLKEKKFYFIGAKNDNYHIGDLGYKKVENIFDAEFIVVSGFNDNEELSYYQNLLSSIIEKKIPLFCVNPDVKVLVGGIEYFCAGSLAEFYQNLGGEVYYFGKPKQSTYQYIFDYYHFDKSKTLAIGDNLDTDIKGANDFGIHSLFIGSGVHRKEFLPSDSSLNASMDSRFSFNYFLSNLTW